MYENNIQEEDILSLFTTYGIGTAKVNNIKWYQRAFIHQSLKSTKRHSKSNERLEFLGDGILDMATKFYLYKRFPKENEGFMTEKKNNIVKNEMIGKIAIEMKLNKWLLMSEEFKHIRTNVKKMGCVFEAFIASMFMDFQTAQVNNGYNLVQTFVENVFEKHINWENLIHNDDNFKNKLQIVLQREFKVTPFYMENKDKNDNNVSYNMQVFLSILPSQSSLLQGQTLLQNKTFLDPINLQIVKEFVSVSNSENKNVFLFLGEGTHKIKKKAEQIASLMALRNLEVD
jgi:ribonuclease-3